MILIGVMTSLKVELRMPDGIKHFDCPDDEYILEAAEQARIDIRAELEHAALA